MTPKLIQELVNIATKASYSKGGYADITRIKKGEDDFNTLHIVMYTINQVSVKVLTVVDINLTSHDAPEQLQSAIDKVNALS